jgi:hypothetical protein
MMAITPITIPAVEPAESCDEEDDVDDSVDPGDWNGGDGGDGGDGAEYELKQAKVENKQLHLYPVWELYVTDENM